VAQTFEGYTDAALIGLRQVAGSSEPKGVWQWVTREEVDYTNWDVGQPDADEGPDADYAELRWSWDAHWNDMNYWQYFIVEAPGYRPGRVTDFTPGEDLLDLRPFGIEGLNAFAERVSQVGTNTLLRMSDLVAVNSCSTG
jgi:hypothetical protein